MSTPNTCRPSQCRKHFIPLESNPTVFTDLIHKLGLSPSLSFQDIYSLDDAKLLAPIPRPAHALILVCPTSEAYGNEAEDEDEDEDGGERYEGYGEEDDIMYFEQTIWNACGLYAILHGVCNGEARKYIEPQSTLSHLLSQTTPLAPSSRATVLESSTALEAAYASVAREGHTAAPAADAEVDFHYFCFVRSHRSGHLFLLDGDRKGGPVDLGEMAEGEDVLGTKCLDVVRGMVARSQGENLNFGLMALVGGE